MVREIKKVYCDDCTHYRTLNHSHFGLMVEDCIHRSNVKESHRERGINICIDKPSYLNCDHDCVLYEEKK